MSIPAADALPRSPDEIPCQTSGRAARHDTNPAWDGRGKAPEEQWCEEQQASQQEAAGDARIEM
jgi:hypothetical protein